MPILFNVNKSRFKLWMNSLLFDIKGRDRGIYKGKRWSIVREHNGVLGITINNPNNPDSEDTVFHKTNGELSREEEIHAAIDRYIVTLDSIERLFSGKHL